MVVVNSVPRKMKAARDIEDRLRHIQVDPNSRMPMHEQIREAVRDAIAGDDAEGALLPAEREFADRLGVSRITVTRALSDLRREGWVSRATRRGTVVVPHSAREEARTNAVAPSSLSATVDEFAIYCVSWKSEFVSELLEHLSTEVAHLNSSLKIYSVLTDGNLAEKLRAGSVAKRSILFLPELASRQLLDVLTERGGWAVTIDQMSGYYPGAVVGTDARMAIRLSLEHLQSLGHNRVTLMVNEPLRAESVYVKVDEFLKEAARRTMNGRVIVCDNAARGSYDSVYSQMDFAWTGNKSIRPTAIMTVSDPGAWAALKWFQEREVDVPGEVSVVGFEDARSSAHTTPRLTTVKHPIGEIVKRSIELLLADKAPDPVVKLVSPELILRDSTGIASD